MLKRMIAAAAAALVSLAAPAFAEPAAAPAQPEAAAPKPSDANPLLPTEADMQKAREEREAGRAPKPVAKTTTIDQVRDQDNRVVEYVVTPGTTHIPYTIQNLSDRPADMNPGGNPRSTPGTTRQIHFGR